MLEHKCEIGTYSYFWNSIKYIEVEELPRHGVTIKVILETVKSHWLLQKSKLPNIIVEYEN